MHSKIFPWPMTFSDGVVCLIAIVISSLIFYFSYSAIFPSSLEEDLSQFIEDDWWERNHSFRHSRLILPPHCISYQKQKQDTKLSSKSKFTNMTKAMLKKLYHIMIRHPKIYYKYHHLNYTIQSDMLSDDFIPLLCFVNSKSGGQQGKYFQSELRKLLNPIQVYDVHDIHPKYPLQLFASLSKFRILICGGDGTITWILNTVEQWHQQQQHQQHMTMPSIAILPIGTGNDLANELGWLECIQNHALSSFLEQVLNAHSISLDRWTFRSIEEDYKIMNIKNNLTVSSATTMDTTNMTPHNTNSSAIATSSSSELVSPSSSSPTPSTLTTSTTATVPADEISQLPISLKPLLPTTTTTTTHTSSTSPNTSQQSTTTNTASSASSSSIIFQNYCGLGIDAQIVLQFHEMRIKSPNFFFHQWMNKIWYGIMGWQEIWRHENYLEYFATEYIELYCDDERIHLPTDCQGIVFVNIQSYGGGSVLWNDRAIAVGTTPTTSAAVNNNSTNINNHTATVTHTQSSERSSSLVNDDQDQTLQPVDDDEEAEEEEHEYIGEDNGATKPFLASQQKKEMIINQSWDEYDISANHPPADNTTIMTDQLAADHPSSATNSSSHCNTPQKDDYIFTRIHSTASSVYYDDITVPSPYPSYQRHAIRTDSYDDGEEEEEEEESSSDDEFMYLATSPKSSPRHRHLHHHDQHQKQHDDKKKKKKKKEKINSKGNHFPPQYNQLPNNNLPYSSKYQPKSSSSTSSSNTLKRVWKSVAMNDGLLEVVVVRNSLELAQIKLGITSCRKLAQGKVFKLVIKAKIPIQFDGEPKVQNPGTYIIRSTPAKVQMLKPVPDDMDLDLVEVLDWAQRQHVITSTQQDMIMQEYIKRVEKRRQIW
jgi:diacylglycerol kinase family enzyme